jgi:hypothetical protein
MPWTKLIIKQNVTKVIKSTFYQEMPMDNINNSLQKIIHGKYESLAAKGRILAEFVLSNPDKAVF